MTHASLFSGFGAADLAAVSLGWTNIFNCEIDPFCQHVLKCHFPDATQYSDIHAADFTIWRGRIDVLTGGFPCQPFSQAGKRRGTDDERYLWGEMLRTIGEIQPRWVVGENVLGIVNWSRGLVFEQVCSDMEAAGYEVTPYVLPAAGVGAPHQRYRVFFVAYRADAGTQTVQREWQDGVHFSKLAANTSSVYGWDLCRQAPRKPTFKVNSNDGRDGITPYSVLKRHEKRHEIRTSGECIQLNGFDRFPTQSPVCSRDDGLSTRLGTNTILNGKRLTYPKWREESIKAYGNAIVPQVLLQIFKTIERYENPNHILWR